MASDSPSALRVAQAQGLGEALSVVEARLAALNPDADPDLVAAGIAAPLQAFNSAAKEAVS